MLALIYSSTWILCSSTSAFNVFFGGTLYIDTIDLSILNLISYSAICVVVALLTQVAHLFLIFLLVIVCCAFILLSLGLKFLSALLIVIYIVAIAVVLVSTMAVFNIRQFTKYELTSRLILVLGTVFVGLLVYVFFGVAGSCSGIANEFYDRRISWLLLQKVLFLTAEPLLFFPVFRWMFWFIAVLGVLIICAILNVDLIMKRPTVFVGAFLLLIGSCFTVTGTLIDWSLSRELLGLISSDRWYISALWWKLNKLVIIRNRCSSLSESTGIDFTLLPFVQLAADANNEAELRVFLAYLRSVCRSIVGPSCSGVYSRMAIFDLSILCDSSLSVCFEEQKDLCSRRLGAMLCLVDEGAVIVLRCNQDQLGSLEWLCRLLPDDATRLGLALKEGNGRAVIGSRSDISDALLVRGIREKYLA